LGGDAAAHRPRREARRMSTLEIPEDPEAFRAVLGPWLEENAPKSLWNTVSTPFQGHWGGTKTPFPSEDHRRWYETCLPLGLTAPSWPKEYGGAGLPTRHARVWSRELQDRELPLPLVGFGLVMIGPILLAEGSEELKREHLPPIVQGGIRWCQGYSEPDAGSDLAALRCRAERDGDHFVVSGQKIWTSHAERADWIFCLVRTSTEGRKQAGISFLLIDMASPGITVRPIQLISGASPFCEVFFDQVRVPVSNVVGDVDNGWRVAKALLQHERTVVGESIAAGGARPTELNDYTLRSHALEQCGLGPDGRLAEHGIRDEIIQSEMDMAVMKLAVRQANERLRVGAHPGTVSSVLKLAGTELNQRRWELAGRIGGLDAAGWDGDEFSARDKALASHLLRSRGNTIEGGTSEVQKNIVARAVLKLPKGPR